jgi:hypothetical protein
MTTPPCLVHLFCIGTSSRIVQEAKGRTEKFIVVDNFKKADGYVAQTAWIGRSEEFGFVILIQKPLQLGNTGGLSGSRTDTGYRPQFNL